MRKRIFGVKTSKVTFIAIGIVSTIWFLVRVVPKPSRAGYPCMKAAAPIMSSFVLYLLAISGSAIFLKRGLKFVRKRQYLAAILLLVAGLVTLFSSSHLFTEKSYASSLGSSPDDYPGNTPYGTGVGNNPGRVIWAWDPGATDENCTNTFNDPVRGADGYFMEKNNNRQIIGRMLDDNVTKLTGAPKVSAAWDSLFIDLNLRKGLGKVSYQNEEKIFIKINQGGGNWLTNDGPDEDLSFIEKEWALSNYGMAETSPIVVIELLDQLVNGYGIPEEDIFVGDPLAHIYKHNYDMMFSEFPNVKYVDRDPNHSDIGRTILSSSPQASIYYSDKGIEMPDAISDTLYSELEKADYLINIASMKAHSLAGVTLTTKNHFGSHTRESAAHLHPGLVATKNDKPNRNEYEMYRVLTDLMGHESLGGNTVLFIVDGLWGAAEATEKPVKWNSKPFNGDWSNSIFVSQDQVALESVCFDFLKSEFKDPEGVGKARPWMGAVDDFLHQAADQQFWPEGIIYDPENDGTPIGSLGVHEHWNNELDKRYSRNLGFDSGIELLQVDKTYQRKKIIARKTKSIPIIDGSFDDRCWLVADWHKIDQTWNPWTINIDSSNFHGQYKISWSDSENLLYYYVEILDNDFIDGYDFPESDYQNYDLLEVYLDENISGGYHAFDDLTTMGSNAENAFSYHIAAQSPMEGGSGSEFNAVDIQGMQWGGHIIDYASHFEEFVMRKEGNLLTYEFSLKVYGDDYKHDDPESSRTELTEGKEMGLALAFTDNDLAGIEKKQHIGSVWVPEDANSDLWMDADYFGIVQLAEMENIENNAVVAVGSIADFEITKSETDFLIHNNIPDLFNDPDGDLLVFSVNCDEALLSFEIRNDQLFVMASIGFEGERKVTLTATDGEYSATVEFDISGTVTDIFDNLQIGPGIICYPNPFSEILHLEFNTGNLSDTEASLVIYDLKGQLVHKENIKVHPGTRTVCDIVGLEGSSGIYILELRFAEDTYSRIINKK